jgi:NAD(P)-dependent dehydrogenase (short-subunit alcohol dehydrogenase family)
MGAVLVTGCSSGIGRACAIELAQAGFKTFAGVRTEGDGLSLRSKSVPGLVPVQLDVRDSGSIEQVVSRLTREVDDTGFFGLVNNAGVSASGPVEFLDIAEIQEVLNVNLLGPVRLVQAFLPMLRQSAGRIINIGSGEAFLSTPINSAYCMSKHALEALSESLRMELAPTGIRVILVEPGGTRTRIMEKAAARFETLGESLPSTARRLYGKSMEARRRMPERGHLQAPEAVARVVRRALADWRPKTRYFVGADVRGAFMLGRLFPSSARDAILRVLFGFPGAVR